MHSVNLPSSNLHRVAFSQAILGIHPDSQSKYWNDQYFQGISPPHVVDSEEGVIRFVSEVEGAIGYINACNLDRRVRAVLWIKSDGKISMTKPMLNCL